MPLFIEYSLKSINQEFGKNFDGGGIFRNHEAYETFMTAELKRLKARCCIVKHETEISEEEYNRIHLDIQGKKGYPAIDPERSLQSSI